MTKRRAKGEGSVYRRSDGRVVGEYLDANGKRRYVSGKTKPEIKDKLRKLLAARDEGIAYDSESLTVGGYLDRWLAAVKGTVRDRTWQRPGCRRSIVRAGWRRKSLFISTGRHGGTYRTVSGTLSPPTS